MMFPLYFQDECRQLICPYGAIRTPDGCKLFAKTWFVPGYEIHVIITPVSEHKIPLEEFNKVTEREPNMNNWLDTKGLDINHLIMYAEEAVQDNITLLGVMNIRLGSDKFPLNAQKLLKAIEKSISRQWVITLDKTVYTYEVEFDIYKKFVQNGNDYRKRWAGTDPQLSSGSISESYKLPKVYTSVLFHTKIIGLQISKMYFCEKVELFEIEWSGAYSGVWLNLTGSGNDTFLGDGEFSYEDDFYGTKVVKVEICADDFLAQFGSRMNAANLCGYTRYLFLFLELVVIFA